MAKGQDIREGAKWYGTGVGMTVIGIITALVLGTGTMLATGTLQKWTANFRGDVKAKEQTKGSGAFRVATYNDFFNLCSAVQSDEDAIRNAEAEIKGEGTTAARKSRLQQVITATKNTRAENVRDYNAKAGNEYKAPFKSNDLPVRLDIADFNTECSYADAG